MGYRRQAPGLNGIDKYRRDREPGRQKLIRQLRKYEEATLDHESMIVQAYEAEVLAAARDPLERARQRDVGGKRDRDHRSRTVD